MSVGPSEFSRAASVAYGNITQADKDELKTSERVDVLSVKDIKREGKKIFQNIQKQVITVSFFNFC